MDGALGKKYLEDYLNKTDPIFKKYSDKKIEEAIKTGELPAELLSKYFEIARKGKKIRGSLVVLGYKAAGGNDEKAILDTSLSLELVHAGFLVHDDIQDRDDTRRGTTTIHKQYQRIGRQKHLGDMSEHFGISMGINAGIAAYFLSIEKLINGDFSSKRIVAASKVYSDYLLRVAHGQALDVSNIFINNINQDELLNILKYKSAEYTGVLPLLIGATLAGREDKKYLQAMREYGLCLGWAFQIQDDILGAFGDSKQIGKPVGSDFQEGKVTLLMLHLSQHGNRRQKMIQKEVLGKQDITEGDIAQMQTALRDAGSYDHVVKLGWDYVKKGERYIPKITKDPKLQNIFRSMLYFMMERAV